MFDLRLGCKRLALFIALLLTLPFIMLARLGCVCGNDNFYSACACFFALVPGKTGSFLRQAYYLGTLQGMSADVFIGFGSYFSQRGAIVGQNVSIGAYCILGQVNLGARTLIASRVSIPSGRRQHAQRYDEQNPSTEMILDRVTVGSDCWIGEGSIIMADLGERCIVSAGSVVTRAMPAGRLVAGNPARPLPASPANQPSNTAKES